MFGFGKKVFTQDEATQLLRCAGKFGILSDKGFFNNTGDIYDRFKYNLPKLVGAQDLRKVDADLWRDVIGSYARLEGIMTMYAFHKAPDREDAMQALAFAKESKSCAEMLLNKMEIYTLTRLGSYESIKNEEMDALERSAVAKGYPEAAEQEKEFVGPYAKYLKVIWDGYRLIKQNRDAVEYRLEPYHDVRAYFELMDVLLDERIDDLSAEDLSLLSKATQMARNEVGGNDSMKAFFAYTHMEQLRLAVLKERYSEPSAEEIREKCSSGTIPKSLYVGYVEENRTPELIDYFNYCSSSVSKSNGAGFGKSDGRTGDDQYDALFDSIRYRDIMLKPLYALSKKFVDTIDKSFGMNWNDEMKNELTACCFAGAEQTLTPDHFAGTHFDGEDLEKDCLKVNIGDTSFANKAKQFYDTEKEIRETAFSSLTEDRAYNVASSLTGAMIADQMGIERSNELFINLYSQFCFEVLAYGALDGTVKRKLYRDNKIKDAEPLQDREKKFLKTITDNFDDVDSDRVFKAICATSRLILRDNSVSGNSGLLDLLHYESCGTDFSCMCENEALIAKLSYDIYGIIEKRALNDEGNGEICCEQFCKYIGIECVDAIKAEYLAFIDDMRNMFKEIVY